MNWTLRNKLEWNCNQNTTFFFHENASENIIYAAICPGIDELKPLITIPWATIPRSTMAIRHGITRTFLNLRTFLGQLSHTQNHCTKLLVNVEFEIKLILNRRNSFYRLEYKTKTGLINYLNAIITRRNMVEIQTQYAYHTFISIFPIDHIISIWTILWMQYGRQSLPSKIDSNHVVAKLAQTTITGLLGPVPFLVFLSSIQCDHVRMANATL